MCLTDLSIDLEKYFIDKNRCKQYFPVCNGEDDEPSFAV